MLLPPWQGETASICFQDFVARASSRFRDWFEQTIDALSRSRTGNRGSLYLTLRANSVEIAVA